MDEVTDAEEFDLPTVEQEPPKPCPECAHDLMYGFGLAGGGFGPYQFCSNDACTYFSKTESVGPEEE